MNIIALHISIFICYLIKKCENISGQGLQWEALACGGISERFLRGRKGAYYMQISSRSLATAQQFIYKCQYSYKDNFY